ncbi:hypothetical protein [Streptomyces specialis]|uniref:hypothetical protein n=1 Tax=Streptomyces specialis TaxID=498367 RepID=UPI001F35DE69|nr:hypothetical protein [Streptomyces specialis]
MKRQTSALSWAVQSGVCGDEARMRWRLGRAVEVPVGTLWEVVRVSRPVATGAIERLRHDGVALGLALEVPSNGSVEFVVPCGTAQSWPPVPETGTVVDGLMRWPAAKVSVANGQRTMCGRQWLVSPVVADALTTDGDALCEAVVASLAHLAFAELPEFATTVRGRSVELPTTIAGIRAALPEDRQAAVAAGGENAPARDLYVVLGHWATQTGPAPRANAGARPPGEAEGGSVRRGPHGARSGMPVGRSARTVPVWANRRVRALRCWIRCWSRRCGRPGPTAAPFSCCRRPAATATARRGCCGWRW